MFTCVKDSLENISVHDLVGCISLDELGYGAVTNTPNILVDSLFLPHVVYPV